SAAAGGSLAPGQLFRPGGAHRRDARTRGTRYHGPGRQRARALVRDPAAQPGRSVTGAAGPGGAAGRARTRARDGECHRRHRVARARGRVAPPGGRVKVQGVVRPPGDKSISHRVLMLAALARGTSELSGLLTGEDVKSTARVLRQLGADISPISAGTVTVRGHRLSPPASRLHCGNSGTSARLLLGLLAGPRFPATL